MPLPAHIRRERRQYNKKAEELAAPKVFPKRACRNCDKKFPKTKGNRLFCSEECRKQYNQYGSAFGPLKRFLLKVTAKMVAEEVQTQTAAATKHIQAQLEDLDRRMRAIEAPLQLLQSIVKTKAAS